MNKTSESLFSFKINTDRHLTGDPEDKLGTLPHEEVRLHRCPLGIGTGKHSLLLEQQTLTPCRLVCKLMWPLCQFAQRESWSDSL